MQTIMFVLQQSRATRPRSADTGLSRKLASPTHITCTYPLLLGRID